MTRFTEFTDIELDHLINSMLAYGRDSWEETVKLDKSAGRGKDTLLVHEAELEQDERDAKALAESCTLAKEGKE